MSCWCSWVAVGWAILREIAAYRCLFCCLSQAIFRSSETTPSLALRSGEQGLHLAQVVGGGEQLDDPVDPAQAAHLHLAKGPVELGPGEDLLDQLALPLADAEAFAQAFFVGQEAWPLGVGLVLGHMRHHLAGAQ